LTGGAGLVGAVSSGAFRDVPVARHVGAATGSGQTGPVELLAAAHAASYVMALVAELGRAGAGAQEPWQLDVDAVATFGESESGWRVLASRLAVRGVVPGLTGAQFQALAAAAQEACPLSQALSGSAAVSVEADLAG
jgi:osmotically inducible protein OsmC